MALSEILTYEELRKVIKKGAALIDFSAPWCASCQVQDSIMQNIAQEYNGRALIAKMNIDLNYKAAEKFGIKSIPTLIIFKNGKEVQRFTGLQPESALSDSLKLVLQ